MEKPITYQLVKEYNLMINILKASVTPHEEGTLVVEISGERKALEKGLEYLSRLGVRIQSLASDVYWDKEKCTHCTACIPLCPTNALALDRKTFLVSFDKKKCIACGLCLRACPYKAIEIKF